MPNQPRRRRSDRPSIVPARPGSVPPPADAAAWVLRCAQRIVEIETHIGLDEALQIARTMHDAERTGAMEPAAAADFVAEQMRLAGRPRFERRAARPAAVTAPDR